MKHKDKKSLLQLIDERIGKISKPVLKKAKKVAIVSIEVLTMFAVALGVVIINELTDPILPQPDGNSETESAYVETETEESVTEAETEEETRKQMYFPEEHKDTMTPEQKQAYDRLQEVSSQKLETYLDYYTDEDGVRRQYSFIKDEEELIRVSRELSVAIKDYFKTYGASDWSNPDEEQFWPENIEYLVAAIAWRETEYRVDVWNEKSGCGGIAGLNEQLLVDTFLYGNWLTDVVWGEHIPYINCNADEIDIFNPVICMKGVYLNIGYNLANFYKQGKYFNDEKTGQRLSVWNKVEFSDEMQNRLLVASHRHGSGDVIDAVFERLEDDRTGKLIYLEDLTCGDYVNDVMSKLYELIDKYENQNARGY